MIKYQMRSSAGTERGLTDVRLECGPSEKIESCWQWKSGQQSER